MTLASGEKLGPYEVLAPLGKGGMGEVYLARDTRLNREVAVKVSTERFSDRFEREERVIASLNHPNICQLYDVGSNFLVMELIDGPTLAERLKGGAIPLEESLNIARQIADALEAAHEKGITHRDLKPGNIKIKPDGAVKVLDFGLAKLGGTPTAQSCDSPTLTMGQTEAGMILGTAAYMSPEQAKGKPVDQRSDIYAFGLVLYEMVTGRRLHDGESTTEVLASVIKEEPRWSGVPPQIEKLLRRCLAKDPQKRLKHIGDVMALVEDAETAPAPAKPQREPVQHRLLWPGVALLSILALAPVNVIHFRERSPDLTPMRFQIPPPRGLSFGVYLALSPDGKRLAFTAVDSDGLSRIWVRDLDTLEARALPGTENAGSVMWSPDGRFIAFGSGNQLKKVEATGGLVQTLCTSATTVGSGSWSKNGTILFGGRGAGVVQQVAESGGMPSPVTQLGKATNHSFPYFLPDGRHFIYLSNAGETLGIYVGSIDVKPEQQSEQLLLATGFGAIFAPDPQRRSGRILFLREGTLMAQPFDPDSLKLTGEAVPVAEGVGSTNIYANVTASWNGTLGYRTGLGSVFQLAWLDREGKQIAAAGPPGPYNQAVPSPDGTRAAVIENQDLWILDFARGSNTRFTFGRGAKNEPVWSPDGNGIVFRSNPAGKFDLYRKASNGAGEEEPLLQTEHDKLPNSWTRDGRFLIYTETSAKAVDEVWALPMSPVGKPLALVQSQFNNGYGTVSPDGRWLAYLSTESGDTEVYVRPFENPQAGKWQVSTGGVVRVTPSWAPDSKELVYGTATGTVMELEVHASIGAGVTFQAGVPHRLFAAPSTIFHAGSDGKRFLVGLTPQGMTGQLITLVLNWQAGLKRP